MKSPVVIFGGNGFLGRYLSRFFHGRGREVVAVARNRKGIAPEAMFIEWDGETVGPWALALEGAGLVINLAGRSVNCRYNEANRAEILNSRVDTTKLIGEAISQCDAPPAVWMNSSTATLYRHAEDHPQDEWTGEPGDGFSVDVAQRWEQAFFGAPTPAPVRKLALRIGMVLGNEEGTVFDVLSRLTRFGLGGAMGSGKQRVSWIHMDDFLMAIEALESNPLADGVFNLTAPDAPTNRELMKRFREVIAMPIGLPAPRLALEAGARVMGSETELILKSRWAEPARLAALGFRWRHPCIETALPDLAQRRGLDQFFEVPVKRSVGARAWTGGKRLSTA